MNEIRVLNCWTDLVVPYLFLSNNFGSRNSFFAFLILYKVLLAVTLAQMSQGASNGQFRPVLLVSIYIVFARSVI